MPVIMLDPGVMHRYVVYLCLTHAGLSWNAGAGAGAGPWFWAATMRVFMPDAVFIFIVAESEAGLARRLVCRNTETPDKLAGPRGRARAARSIPGGLGQSLVPPYTLGSISRGGQGERVVPPYTLGGISLCVYRITSTAPPNVPCFSLPGEDPRSTVDVIGCRRWFGCDGPCDELTFGFDTRFGFCRCPVNVTRVKL